MEQFRGSYLTKIERAIKSDNPTSLTKILKLEEDDDDFSLKSNLEQMKLPKGILHFCVDQWAVNCITTILGQNRHAVPDLNSVYKGQTLLTRLIDILSKEQKRKKDIEKRSKHSGTSKLGISKPGEHNKSRRMTVNSSHNISLNTTTTSSQDVVTKIFQLLLDTGLIDPNKPRKDGWSPLMLACFFGIPTAVEILIDTGRVEQLSQNEIFDLKQKHFDGSEDSHSSVLNIDSFNPETGLLPIHVAAANGNTETVDILAAENPASLFSCEFGWGYDDLNLENANTPFMMAAINSHIGTAENLLKLQREKMIAQLDAVTKYKKY